MQPHLARVFLSLAVVAVVTAPSRAARAQTDAGAGVSVGTPRAGRLEGRGAELPVRGVGYHWVTNHGNPDARFATPSLAAAVQRALAAVARRYPGSDLAVFDFGHPGGGRIQGHASHTSGRDGDLGYFARDAAGAPVVLAGPVVLAPDGRGTDPVSGQRVALDAERTWALMRALLDDPGVRVLRFFVYPPLRAQLLAQVRAGGGSAAELARAADVLRPSGRANAPHDDHFHIRIACPDADRARGCRD